MNIENLQREIENLELRLFDANESVKSLTQSEDVALAASAISYTNGIEAQLKQAHQQLKAAVIGEAPQPLPLTPDTKMRTPYPVDALPYVSA